jgi:hypothetical protein
MLTGRLKIQRVHEGGRIFVRLASSGKSAGSLSIGWSEQQYNRRFPSVLFLLRQVKGLLLYRWLNCVSCLHESRMYHRLSLVVLLPNRSCNDF